MAQIIEAADIQQIFGETTVIEEYNNADGNNPDHYTIKYFDLSVKGEACVRTDKQETLRDSKAGKVLFTEDINSFRKILEDLADGWHQTEAERYCLRLYNQYYAQFEKILSSPKLCEKMEETLESKLGFDTSLKEFEEETWKQIEDVIEKSGKKGLCRILKDSYNDSMEHFERVIGDYSQALDEVKKIWQWKKPILESYMNAILRKHPSAAKSQCLCYAEIGKMISDGNRSQQAGELVLKYCNILKDLRTKEFPYNKFSDYLDAKEISDIKPEDAKYLLRKLNKSVKAFSGSGLSVSNLIFPFSGNKFYVGNTEKLLEVTHKSSPDFMKKVYKTIVTPK